MQPDSSAMLRPTTLEGRLIRLEPLSMAHASELYGVAADEEIWRYMPVPPPESVADVQRWIEEALEKQKRGERVPFAVVERATGRAIGSTSYLDLSPANRHLEIGWTWLGRAYWRTGVNTEAKYLLLRNAFENLGCIRVQLKTDLRNVRAQQAIERLGCVREGVLRKAVIQKGFQRWSVYYSILDDEWPAVKPRLENRLNRLVPSTPK